MKKLLITLLFTVCSFTAHADNLSDSNTLFDWAENMYPQFFSPSGMETSELEGYLVRYYEDTDTYVGTSSEEVYVYGQDFNGLAKVGQICDFIQTENIQFTSEWLNGQTLYNVYYDDDDNDWDFCEFTFTDTGLTMNENGSTDEEDYSVTAEGYLVFEDPDTEEGEETEFNVVEVTEKTIDYLMVAWADSVEEANNNGNDDGDEFFFFDQQKALDFQNAHNENLMDTNALFSWAQTTYPEYFSQTNIDTNLDKNNLTRYYEETTNYIRISNGEVSVGGNSFSGQVDVGNLSDFFKSTIDTFTNELLTDKTMRLYTNQNFHININDDGSYDGTIVSGEGFFGTWKLTDGDLILTPDADCTVCNGVSTFKMENGYTFNDDKILLFLDLNDGAKQPVYWLE